MQSNSENMPTTQQEEKSDASGSPQQDKADMTAIMREAEQRGYERARAELADENACPAFLTHIRPGFWD